MFSRRLPASLAPNALSQAISDARAAGAELIDLTETNPTRVDLAYPDGWLSALSDPRGGRYEPHALGSSAAREAVADLAFAGRARPYPRPLVLTASTSEAYAFLFKLLCDAGDDVLVPQPSYPLFDLLTRLEAVQPAPYRLDSRRWSIDRASLERRLVPASRAVLVVSPNNPTGSMLRAADRDVARGVRRGRAAGADRRRGVRRLSVVRRAGWRVARRRSAGADLHARRPVEVRRPPADEAGLDRRERARRRSSARRSIGSR